MSSATSIDRVEADRVPAADSTRERDAFRPWHFFVLASLLAASAAVILTRDLPAGYSWAERLVLYGVISVTIGAAGFAAGALYRTLVPLVSPRAAAASERRLTEGMRAVLEREKLLVLRSIKELEFDRAMGKVSAKDFDEMAGRLRARALALIRQLDAEGAGYRELIERELSARMRGLPDRRDSPRPGASGRCLCGTVNDADAMFCKRCGTKLERTAS